MSRVRAVVTKLVGEDTLSERPVWRDALPVVSRFT